MRPPLPLLPKARSPARLHFQLCFRLCHPNRAVPAAPTAPRCAAPRLQGLAKYGKGDWRSISRNFVITRTPTQAGAGRQVAGGPETAGPLCCSSPAGEGRQEKRPLRGIRRGVLYGVSPSSSRRRQCGGAMLARLPSYSPSRPSPPLPPLAGGQPRPEVLHPAEQPEQEGQAAGEHPRHHHGGTCGQRARGHHGADANHWAESGGGGRRAAHGAAGGAGGAGRAHHAAAAGRRSGAAPAAPAHGAGAAAAAGALSAAGRGAALCPARALHALRLLPARAAGTGGCGSCTEQIANFVCSLLCCMLFRISFRSGSRGAPARGPARLACRHLFRDAPSLLLLTLLLTCCAALSECTLREAAQVQRRRAAACRTTWPARFRRCVGGGTFSDASRTFK